MKIKVQGYEANNYDATYNSRSLIFEENVVGAERKMRLLDLNSGREYIFVVPMIKVETPSHKREKETVRVGLPRG